MPSAGHVRFVNLFRVSVLLFLIPLASCMLRSRKQAAVPPPPKPAAVQDSAPEGPLSVPQTAVVLPSMQQVNPEAIPPPPAPATPVQTGKTEQAAPAQRSVRHPSVAAPKPEPPPEETPAPAPAPPQAADEKGPFQPILSPEEKKRLQDSVDARMREIDSLLAHVKGPLSDHDRSVMERIQSSVSLAKDAARRGDYTQANDLTDRALILARELNVE